MIYTGHVVGPFNFTEGLDQQMQRITKLKYENMEYVKTLLQQGEDLVVSIYIVIVPYICIGRCLFISPLSDVH
jgi:hypothetical protein